MMTIRKLGLLLLFTAVLLVSKASADASLTPHASLNHSFGALPTDGIVSSFTDAFGGTNYHAYHFNLLFDVQNGNGTYLNIQTKYDTDFDFGFGVDTVVGLYDSSGNKVADDDDGNSVPGDDERLSFSMLTFGTSDPFGENLDATPEDKHPGDDTPPGGVLPAGWYTLAVVPFDGSVLPPHPLSSEHASLPATIGSLDALGGDAGGPLDGDYGDYSVQIRYNGGFEPGDFNTDSVRNAADIDLLAANNGNTTNAVFDLNGDGMATFAIGGDSDSDLLIRTYLGTEYGDANLDGKVNSSDAAILGGSFGTQAGATWSMNDANGDGKVNSSDAAIMGGNFGFGQGGAAAVLDVQAAGAASVPEPSGLVLVVASVCVAAPFLRGRRRVRLE